MTVHRLHSEVIARTVCPAGHRDSVEAINPVVRGGELLDAAWPSAIDFCMECDSPVSVTAIEVNR